MKMQLNNLLKISIYLLCSIITIVNCYSFANGKNNTGNIFSLKIEQYDSNNLLDLKFIVNIDTLLEEIEMPLNSLLELNSLEFLYPYDENYLWVIPEVEFFNAEFNNWERYDLKLLGSFDQFSVILDPSLENKKIVKKHSEYTPLLFSLDLLPHSEKLFRIRFFARFTYRGVAIILKSNWVNLQ